MATFHFELVSPEKSLFSGEVKEVIVPGKEGEFGVLKNHAPFMSSLKPGLLTILTNQGSQKIFIRGGLAETGTSGLSILAEYAMPIEQLNAQMVSSQIKEAEEDLADAKTDSAKSRAKEHLDQLKEVQGLLNLTKS